MKFQSSKVAGSRNAFLTELLLGHQKRTLGASKNKTKFERSEEFFEEDQQSGLKILEQIEIKKKFDKAEWNGKKYFLRLKA